MDLVLHCRDSKVTTHQQMPLFNSRSARSSCEFSKTRSLIKLAVTISFRGSLELSDITTTTTTARSSTRERPTLDELYLPNRCFDQGYWQEVELEI